MRFCLFPFALWPILFLSEVSWAATFAIAVLPDTQFYSQSYATQFHAQTQWIVDNKAAENIVLVSHVGDIVQNGGDNPASNFAEWNVADGAMGVLDAREPNLPYGMVLGNHDLGVVNNQASAGQYVNFFGASRFAGRSWYGGSSLDERNHYQLFSTEGRTYMHIALEWRPPPSSITWARSILAANPTIPTILSTHEYTTTTGARNAVGDAIYGGLVRDNSQVFMVLSGHVLGEGHQTALNGAGEEVFELLADYQGRANGGDGWMQLIEFDEIAGQINVRTFSPTLDRFETDANSQFSFSVDFNDRFGPPVPEPSALVPATLALGVFVFWTWRRRKRFDPLAGPDPRRRVTIRRRRDQVAKELPTPQSESEGRPVANSPRRRVH